MAKLDVAILVTTLGFGGTERFARDLTIGLAQRGLKPCVLYDTPPDGLKEEIESAGIPTYCIGGGDSWGESSYVSRLTVLLQEIQPRLLHANIWDHLSSVVKVARANGIPVVISRHGTDELPRVRDVLGLNRVPFYLYRQRALMRNCGGGLLCVTTLGLDHAKRRFGAGIPMEMVYTGVPPARVFARVADDSNGLQVIWAGTMRSLKRPFLALRAFARVQEMLKGIHLLMLGNGSELESVRSAAAELAPGSVTLAGYVRDPLLYLSQSHVFLHTSYYEGLPYAIKDAMSVGLPVVATDAGGTREAVIHEVTGLLTAVDDEDAISKALEMLLRDASLRLAYGAAGLKLCQTRFGIDDMISATIEAYRDLCGVDFACPTTS